MIRSYQRICPYFFQFLCILLPFYPHFIDFVCLFQIGPIFSDGKYGRWFSEIGELLKSIYRHHRLHTTRLRPGESWITLSDIFVSDLLELILFHHDWIRSWRFNIFYNLIFTIIWTSSVIDCVFRVLLIFLWRFWDRNCKFLFSWYDSALPLNMIMLSIVTIVRIVILYFLCAFVILLCDGSNTH